MAKRRVEETLIRIEETQAALRGCIEKARELAEDSERLIRRHRTEVVQPKPENPAQ